MEIKQKYVNKIVEQVSEEVDRIFGDTEDVGLSLEQESIIEGYIGDMLVDIKNAHESHEEEE